MRPVGIIAPATRPPPPRVSSTQSTLRLPAVIPAAVAARHCYEVVLITAVVDGWGQQKVRKACGRPSASANPESPEPPGGRVDWPRRRRRRRCGTGASPGVRPRHVSFRVRVSAAFLAVGGQDLVVRPPVVVGPVVVGVWLRARYSARSRIGVYSMRAVVEAWSGSGWHLE